MEEACQEEAETDHCWEILSGKMEDEVLDKYMVEDSSQRQKRLVGMEADAQKQEMQNRKVRENC